MIYYVTLLILRQEGTRQRQRQEVDELQHVAIISRIGVHVARHFPRIYVFHRTTGN